jgi:hypothetical protein
MASGMKELNCELLELTILFDAKKFKHDAFRKAVDCEVPEHHTYPLHFANGSEHAHYHIALNGEESLLQVGFVEGEVELEDTIADVPFEESLIAISNFFTKKKFQANLTAVFAFDENFSSLVKLKYPLMIRNRNLKEAIISGHEIELAEDSVVKRIFLSSKINSTIVIINAVPEINLGKFRLYDQIEQFAKYANAFVTRRSAENE